MRPSVNFADGKASRSLQACYKAMAQQKLPKVKHLDRGVFGWHQADLPFVDVWDGQSSACHHVFEMIRTAATFLGFVR